MTGKEGKGMGDVEREQELKMAVMQHCECLLLSNFIIE